MTFLLTKRNMNVYTCHGVKVKVKGKSKKAKGKRKKAKGKRQKAKGKRKKAKGKSIYIVNCISRNNNKTIKLYRK